MAALGQPLGTPELPGGADLQPGGMVTAELTHILGVLVGTCQQLLRGDGVESQNSSYLWR